MKNALSFFKTIGILKNIQRQGLLYYGVKNADSMTDHMFRLAAMVWFFGEGKNLNLAKAFKLALVHDFCKVYTGDITPYEGLIPNSNKDKYKIAWRWRRLSLVEKQKAYKKKYKKEYRAIKKLVARLPLKIRTSIISIWLDFQKVGSPEAKFVSQLDRVENLLESLECWEKDKRFPTLPWWEDADEVVYDKELLDLMEEISAAEVKKSGGSKKSSRS